MLRFLRTLTACGILGWTVPGAAFALSCEEITNMLSVGVPTNIVVQTIEDSAELNSGTTACLQKRSAPATVISVARKLEIPSRAPVVNTPANTPANTTPEPHELKDAVKQYKAKKPMSASYLLFNILASGEADGHEAKVNYYLARSFQEIGLHHSALATHMQVIKEGPATTYFQYSLPQVVSLSESLDDWTELRRIAHKVPTADIPRGAKNTMNYWQGVRAYDKDDLSTAMDKLEEISPSSSRYVKASYLRGVIFTQQNKFKSATKAFRDTIQHDLSSYTQAADLRDAKATQDLALMGIGRIYYDIQRYEEALRYSLLVPDTSPYWSRASLEAAWAAWMLDDIEQAQSLVDRINTNATPADKRSRLIDKGRSDEIVWPAFLPEREILQALILIRQSRWEDAAAGLKTFEATYRALHTELSTFVKKYSTDAGRKKADEAYATLFAGKPGLQEGRQLLPELLRSQELRGVVEHIALLDGERVLIDSQKARWTDSVGPYLKATLDKDKSRYELRAGLMSLTRLSRISNNLGDLLTQSEILRFEAVDAQRADYPYKQPPLSQPVAEARPSRAKPAPAPAPALPAIDPSAALAAANKALPIEEAPRRTRERPEPKTRTTAPRERRAKVLPGSGLESIPGPLRDILEGAGWTPTSDHSSTFEAGDILRAGSNTPVARGPECFDAEPRMGEYDSFEVLQALKAGGRLPVSAAATVKADGMLYRQVRYTAPYVAELSEMNLQPNANCRAFLGKKASEHHQLYVVQAVMKAEVKEKTCQELTAEVTAGRIGFEASEAGQCSRESEGHVAVAFKLLPIANILQ